MTLVQDHAIEAVAEVVSILRGRVDRCGDGSTITVKRLGQILSSRFGIHPSGLKFLVVYVLGFLEARGVLTFWDTTPRSVVYKINQSNLLNNI